MTGREREDAWLRSRRFIGHRDPNSNPGGYEKWPVFSAAVPPELAAELDAAQRKSLGVNASKTNATRANLVRAGLRLYLNTVDPPTGEPIETTAVDLPTAKPSPAGLPRSRWS
jgi:hypothetical protein